MPKGRGPLWFYSYCDLSVTAPFFREIIRKSVFTSLKTCEVELVLFSQESDESAVYIAAPHKQHDLPRSLTSLNISRLPSAQVYLIRLLIRGYILWIFLL